MPLSHRSLSLLVLCPAAMMLAACSPQTQSSPLTASAIEPARIDAPMETPTVETSPLDASSTPSASVYRSSTAQRRFEKKQRGCQADPVPDECIN